MKMVYSAKCRIGMFVPVKALAVVLITTSVLCLLCAETVAAQNVSGVLQIDGKIALASLMSLSDGHLQKIADSYKTLAQTDEVRSAEWGKIKDVLDQTAKRNVDSVAWFALPDGTYWTVQEGLSAQKLIDRPYFPRLLAGKTVMGDMVVSKSTGKSTAIVAVPVMRNGTVVGILGSSVYLDRLSKQIQKEMALDRTIIFYSFDAQPLVGLNWDPQLIFLEPMKQENESLKRAFREMLSKNDGVVSYQFRNEQRRIIYRRSPITNWWYAFGTVQSGK